MILNIEKLSFFNINLINREGLEYYFINKFIILNKIKIVFILKKKIVIYRMMS